MPRYPPRLPPPPAAGKQDSEPPEAKPEVEGAEAAPPAGSRCLGTPTRVADLECMPWGAQGRGVEFR